MKTAAESKAVARVQGLTGEFEWYTPSQYLEAAIEVMGAIDLDPASSKRAQKHVNASSYFTIKQDGLTQLWLGRVWLNPPYAMPYIKQFSAKMVDSVLSGSVSQAIMLTNHATDTEWFHKLAQASCAICFTRGRISFLEARGGQLIEKGSPTHGQTFFYFGNDASRFAEIFSKFGLILCKR